MNAGLADIARSGFAPEWRTRDDPNKGFFLQQAFSRKCAEHTKAHVGRSFFPPDRAVLASRRALTVLSILNNSKKGDASCIYS